MHIVCRGASLASHYILAIPELILRNCFILMFKALYASLQHHTGHC